MKKITLTALALCAFAFTQAQDLKFGVKGGVNFANLNVDYGGVYGNYGGFDDNYKMKVGFNAGGFVEYKFTDKWAIQPEVLYSLQGSKQKFNDIDGNYDVKTNLSYINVPVMVKFYPIPKLYAEAGPQVGFLISAKEKYSEKVFVSADSDEMDDNIDVKDHYKSIDFGFNVGAGYEFTENLFVNLRYNIGLSNIDDTPSTSEYNYDEDDFYFGGLSLKTKNSVLSLSVGYKF